MRYDEESTGTILTQPGSGEKVLPGILSTGAQESVDRILDEKKRGDRETAPSFGESCVVIFKKKVPRPAGNPGKPSSTAGHMGKSGELYSHPAQPVGCQPIR